MKKVTKKKVVVEPYTASVKILGRVYTATGTTAKDAFLNLKPNGVARGMGILTLSKDGVSREKILPSVQISRMFSPSPLVREIALKNVGLRFDL